MRRKFHATQLDLVDLYVNQLLSQAKIAEYYKVSRATIERYLHKWSITRTPEQDRASLKINPPGRKLATPLDITELRYLYSDQGLSMNQIAKIKGCSPHTVRTVLDNYNVKAPQKEINGVMRRFKPEVQKIFKTKPHSEKELREWLINEKLTVKEVAKRLSVTPCTVHNWKRRYGIYLPLAESRKYANAVRWRDDRKDIIIQNGYKEIYKPDHPRSDINGRVQEHFVIVEAMMGRMIAANEIVHHIDMDKLNNNKWNLSVIHTVDHAKIHKYYQLVGLYLSGVRSTAPDSFKFRQLSFWAGSWVWWVDLLGDVERRVA
jgi:transposase